MTGWLNDLTTWLVELVKAIFAALADLLSDFFLACLDLVLTMWANQVDFLSTIMPQFLSDQTVCGLLAQAGPTMAWVMDVFHIPAGVTAVSAAIAFRLARKVVTLFQW